MYWSSAPATIDNILIYCLAMSAGRSRTGSPNPEDCYGEDSIWEDKCESHTTPRVSAEARGG